MVAPDIPMVAPGIPMVAPGIPMVAPGIPMLAQDYPMLAQYMPASKIMDLAVEGSHFLFAVSPVGFFSHFPVIRRLRFPTLGIIPFGA